MPRHHLPQLFHAASVVRRLKFSGHSDVPHFFQGHSTPGGGGCVLHDKNVVTDLDVLGVRRMQILNVSF
ncbi:hypothetical protein CEXT_735331 [Caerostris extrusa]|uniref:Uncharacterized protein n=1 Tax=Caerostris extrusa TaxID=172846 RepID=A0AAV4Y734_CAEEX|nr:hypothetical protein CEXT_735331 [Caerostris extrusa]